MNTDSAKYTVVEFINAFGTKAYALRSPSGVDIDTDYANEQKLQRRADDLNKEIEVASANLRNRNMELEAALEVTTESLNKANYEKYLLEKQMRDGFAFDDEVRDMTWQKTKEVLDMLRGQIRKSMKELNDSQMRSVNPLVQSAYRSLELALNPVFATYEYRCDYCQAPMRHARRAADTAGGDSQVCENCYPFGDEQFQEPDFDEIYRQQIEKDNEDIP